MAEETRPSGGGTSTTGEAQEKAREVVGQAQEKAQEAAGQAQNMLREQVDQRSTEAGQRVSGTAEDLRSVGTELRNQGKETPAKLAEDAADRAERLGSYLSESDGDRILSDIEDFGRRQPLAVLAGGLVLGMAAARFLKASSSRRYQGRLGSEIRTRELSRSYPTPPPVSTRPPEPVGATATRQEPPLPADGVRR
jgi:hypothetical protein